MVAISFGSGGVAYAQSSAPTAAAKNDESVVVTTTRRKALQTATDRKKNSDTVIDSVVADEAGKLPDNSITEVLQRVSGVSIVRYGSLGDPDHFSAEGSGIQVRGLSGVAGFLNGREVFSANGGQGLLWGDVTPELMAAVDVYKDSTADRLIGGTGGAIDLRTKMPFDYKKPSFQASLGASYGDLVKKTTPEGSFLVTNRWDTPIGEIGALVDLAYSKYSAHDNFIRMEPFYKRTVAGQTRYIPGGFDYGSDDFNRERTGEYAAFQWKPNDHLQFYTTLFSSKYKADNTDGGEFVVGTNFTVNPAGHNVFDSNGGLISTDSLTTFNTSDGSLNGTPFNVGGDVGRQNSDHITSDWTTGFIWHPNDRTQVTGAIQFVDSESHARNYDLFPSVAFPGTFGLDISGKLPVVTMPASGNATFANPKNYFIGADMTHIESNHGSMGAANFDVDWAVSDTGFIRDIKWGARYASRTERDNVSSYNWSDVCQGWDGCDNNPATSTKSFANAPAGDISTAAFQNFFRGKISVPISLLTASNALVARFDPTYIRKQYGSGSGTNQVAINPNTDYSHGVDKTSEAYVEAKFASDTGLFNWPVTGNFGVRYVKVEHQSAGHFVINAQSYAVGTTIYTLAAVNKDISGGRETTATLPSFNIAFAPDPTVKIRLAANTTMDLPSYTATKATGSGSVSLTNSTPPQLNNFTTTSGNPSLKPMFSNNLDLSVEWYKSNSFNAHMAFFNKDIKNILIYGTSAYPVNFTFTAPTAQTVSELAITNNVFNSPDKAKISGYELGVRQFFDTLPSPWNGLGYEATYTHIHSENPGDLAYAIDNVVVTNATTNVVTNSHPLSNNPIAGLSDNNLNFTAMYEHGPWSLRAAYSWRSKYLMSTNANGTNGTYTIWTYPRTNPGNGSCDATGVDTTNLCAKLGLPVYSAPYGQVDLGGNYKFNDHVLLSIEATNVTNATPRTLQGGYPNGALYARSWFTTDRRVSASLRLSF
jgi:TonB-dependent receptor